MPSKPQDGELFSRVYLRPAAPLRDSSRFRVRLGGYLDNAFDTSLLRAFVSAVESKLGVRVPWVGAGRSVRKFFDEAELRDVLDSITLVEWIFEEEDKQMLTGLAKNWRQFVTEALQEEGLGYKFDARGGVRFVVDEEFERNRQSVIAGLGDPRYANVAHLVETAFSKVDTTPFDAKSCVREMFEAAETLMKLITDSNQDLDERFVTKTLKPLAQGLYQRSDPAAAAAAVHLLDGFGHWVNAGHKYRHGHKSEEPVAPPDEIAVLFVSEGAAYIRWLIDLDRLQRKLESR